jgi:DNA polymerase III delta prime subunit
VNITGLVLHPSASEQLDSLLTRANHAVLLAGPLGIGKTHIAVGLAAALLDQTQESLPNHPYFRVIRPEKGAINIEQIRGLINFFRLMVPGKQHTKRVVVIQDAELMGREAQNALLKLLEEPPSGSVLLLTSSYPDQLLPTIQSRTQLVMLTAPEQATLVQHFVSQGIDVEIAQRTLLRTGTNVAEATRLLTSDTDSDDILALVKQALSGTPYSRMLLVDGLAKQKELASSFVATLATTTVASLQAAAVKNPTAISRWQTILEAGYTAAAALDANGNTKLVLSELMLAL